jgi:hypothetical protein
MPRPCTTSCFVHQVNHDHTPTMLCIPTAVVGDWHYSPATNPCPLNTCPLHPAAHPPAYEGLPSPSSLNLVLCPSLHTSSPPSHTLSPLPAKSCPAHPPSPTHNVLFQKSTPTEVVGSFVWGCYQHAACATAVLCISYARASWAAVWGCYRYCMFWSLAVALACAESTTVG